jgi:hypothetical protein
MSNLFISHSTKDKAEALKLYEWLTAYDYDFPFRFSKGSRKNQIRTSKMICGKSNG